jgi:hypothetical protein
MNYQQLMNEVNCINAAYNWIGSNDAMNYIRNHKAEYEGTAVWSQYSDFLNEAANLFIINFGENCYETNTESAS